MITPAGGMSTRLWIRPAYGLTRCINHLTITSITPTTGRKLSRGARWPRAPRLTTTPRLSGGTRHTTKPATTYLPTRQSSRLTINSWTTINSARHFRPLKRSSVRRERSITSPPRICWKTRACATPWITSSCPAGNPPRLTITVGWWIHYASSRRTPRSSIKPRNRNSWSSDRAIT